jgi:serine/threonine-protein kinase
MDDHDTIKTLPRNRETGTSGAMPVGIDSKELIDGRYRIERELGQGAMGVVYEASDLGLGRRVALKVITRELAADPAFVERFVREAKALASIRHQNIVQVHALGQHRGAWYYAMELVHGRALDSLVFDHVSRGTRLPTREALGIIRQIASGLSAVHAARIIHRDVKPANVMLEQETGRPVLIDFGIARPAFNGKTRSTLLVGSPAYMAPEQIQAQNGVELTPAADLYALGCVAYELFALRPPFNSSDVYEVLRDQVSTPAAPISAHRPDLARFDALIARLLAKRPEERPGGCLAVVRELDRLTLDWESEHSASLSPTSPSLAGGERMRVTIVSRDPVFLAHARQAAALAFSHGWEEIEAGAAHDRTYGDSALVVLLHVDGLDDHGVSYVSRLRDLQAAGHARVLAFGGAVDPLDRWRLSSLGVTELHAPRMGPAAIAEVITTSVDRGRHSGMPGARLSTIVRPATPDAANTRVPVELFLLVLASAWAEGALPPRAGAMVLDAARAEGYEGDTIAALERACSTPIDLVDVDVSDLSIEVRAYAYAFATWLALSDGVISQREESTLHVVAFVLGLPVGERTAIQSTVEQVRERGALSPRDGFRVAEFSRSVAPAIVRVLRGPRHAPIPGVPVPFRP